MKTHLIFAIIGIAIGLSTALFLRSLQVGSGSEKQSADSAVSPATASPSSAGETLAHNSGSGSGSDSGSENDRPNGKSWEDLDISGPAADAATLSAFLERHDYSKEALIAAALLSSNPEHFRELAKRYPDDAHVQLLIISNDVFPDEKREWIDRFKASQPDNALASLLLGGDLLAKGAVDEGLAELRLSASQKSFNDFSIESMLANESALIEFGHSTLETKLRSTMGHKLQHLKQSQEVVKSLKDLANDASSPAEKTELATLGVGLGNQLSQGGGNLLMINQLVGLGIEGVFLNMLDPELESASFSQSPPAMLEEIRAERKQIVEAISANERISELNEQQLIHYLDRVRTSGELNALGWLKTQLRDAE